MNEQVALMIEGKIVSVADSAGNCFDFGSVGRQANDGSALTTNASSMSAWIFVPFDEVALIFILKRAGSGSLGFNFAIVANDAIDHSIVAKLKPVRAVFATVSLESNQRLFDAHLS